MAHLHKDKHKSLNMLLFTNNMLNTSMYIKSGNEDYLRERDDTDYKFS